jgi:hypothetical protein
MYRYAEEPVVPVRVSPLYYIWSLLPGETVDALLREVAEVHPYGGKLKPEGYVRSFIPPEPDPHITAAEVIGAENLTAQLYASFSHAPAPVIREVAQYILDTEYSEAVRDLYALFTPKYPGMTPPEFPLDPTPIIRRWEEKRRIQQADGEDPPLSVLGLTEMYLLARVHHPAVKKLGARLMQAEDQPSRAHGIYMYYGANYEPADRDSLAALLTDMKAEGWATAADTFIRLLHADTPELPFEQIPFVYAHTDEFLRGELVEALLDTGRMTEEILEECRVDGSSLVHTVLRDHGITGAWGEEIAEARWRIVAEK